MTNQKREQEQNTNENADVACLETSLKWQSTKAKHVAVMNGIVSLVAQ